MKPDADTVPTRDASDACSPDELLLASLQRILKPKTSSSPKREHLVVAIALAQNPGLVSTTACKAAGFQSSGTRTTIVGYRDRIVAEGLLSSACTAPLSFSTSSLLPSELLVKPAWIRQHVPGITDFHASPLHYDGNQATRILRARVNTDGSAFTDGRLDPMRPLPPHFRGVVRSFRRFTALWNYAQNKWRHCSAEHHDF